MGSWALMFSNVFGTFFTVGVCAFFSLTAEAFKGERLFFFLDFMEFLKIKFDA